MPAAKIRRGKARSCGIPGFPQRNPCKGLPFRKYPKSGLFGSLRSKVPAGSGGTTAYFGGGHRAAPRLLAPGSDLVSLFPAHNTGFFRL